MKEDSHLCIQALEETIEVIKERAAVYGSTVDICSRIATLWSVTLGIEIKPEQVPLCLMQLKIARLCNKPEHDDSIIDIAGYASVLYALRQHNTHQKGNHKGDEE